MLERWGKLSHECGITTGRMMRVREGSKRAGSSQEQIRKNAKADKATTACSQRKSGPGTAPDAPSPVSMVSEFAYAPNQGKLSSLFYADWPVSPTGVSTVSDVSVSTITGTVAASSIGVCFTYPKSRTTSRISLHVGNMRPLVRL